MKTVEVFKTNVCQVSDAKNLVESLLQLLPQCKINFDLDDRDNILRIESIGAVDVVLVSDHFSSVGYSAEILE